MLLLHQKLLVLHHPCSTGMNSASKSIPWLLEALSLFLSVEIASAQPGAKIRACTASAAVHLQTEFHHRSAQGDLRPLIGELHLLLCHGHLRRDVQSRNCPSAYMSVCLPTYNHVEL